MQEAAHSRSEAVVPDRRGIPQRGHHRSCQVRPIRQRLSAWLSSCGTLNRSDVESLAADPAGATDDTGDRLAPCWHLFVLQDGTRSAVVSALSASPVAAETLARAAAADAWDFVEHAMQAEYVGIIDRDVCQLV